MRETYGQRDEELAKLGFSSYREYLGSSLWKTIRKAVYRRDNYRCRICKNTAQLEAHHVSYTLPVLLGIDPGAIVTLCSICHRWCETDKYGAKMTLDDVQKKTFKLVTGFKGPVARRRVSLWLRTRTKQQQHVARRIAGLLRAAYPPAVIVIEGGKFTRFLGNRKQKKRGR